MARSRACAPLPAPSGRVGPHVPAAAGALALVLLASLVGVATPFGAVPVHTPAGGVSGASPKRAPSEGATPGAPAIGPNRGDGALAFASGGWSAQCAGCGPGALVDPAMAYDPTMGYVLLFGGYNSTTQAPESFTWAYDSGTWTNISGTVQNTPPARYLASMAFDQDANEMVLFGGEGVGGPLGDTWTFASGTWTEYCAACGPSARYGAAAAYNVPTGETLLFGGCGTSTCPLGDTWEFAGSGWTELCASGCGPGARYDASMAYDPSDAEVVLFGGTTGTKDLDDTWTLSVSTWSLVCASCAPAGRTLAAMSTDTADRVVLLFGGWNASTGTPLGDTWEFLAGAWSEPTLGAKPPARDGSGVADDPPGAGVVLFGGSEAASDPSDLWAFFYGLSATAQASTSAVEEGSPVTFTATASGGSGVYQYTWVGLPVGCSSSDGAVVSCTPGPYLVNSTFSIEAVVSDSNGAVTASPPIPFEVFASLGTKGIAGRTSVDSGQWMNFTDQLYDGDAPYQYTWSGLPTGCSPADLDPLPCRPTGISANESTTVSVTAEDALDGSATATLAVTVEADPVVTPVSVNVSEVEDGFPILLSSAVDLGAGGYDFAWSGLPSGCASVDLPVFSCTVSGVPTNQTYHPGLNVTDANGFVVASPSTSLGVIAGPDLSLIVLSPATLDAGETAEISVRASDGVAPYSFAWTGLPAGCVPQDSPDLRCTPAGVTQNSTYAISVSLTDANGQTATSGPYFLFVNTDPVVSSAQANRSSVDAGQAVLFGVRATGGSGVYTFQWNGLPSGCGSSDDPQIACTPSPTSSNQTYQATVTVTDSSGFSLTSAAATLLVDVPLQLSAVSASRPSIDVGESTVLTVTPSGGAGGYRFDWYGLPSGCSGVDAPELNCTPSGALTSNGSFAIAVVAFDLNGATAESVGFVLTVDARPAIVSLSAPFPDVEVGEAFRLNATAVGGDGTYVFEWSGLPAGCAGSSDASSLCDPTAASNDVVSVTVLDGRGVSSLPQELDLSVGPELSVTSFEADPSHLTVGENGSLEAVVVGGIGTLSFVYTGLPGCPSEDAASLNCLPDRSGTFQVHLSVTDARGITATASLNWKVSPEDTSAKLFGLPVLEAALLVGGVAAVIALLFLVAIPWRRGTLFSRASREPSTDEGVTEEPGGEGTDEGRAPSDEEAASSDLAGGPDGDAEPPGRLDPEGTLGKGPADEPTEGREADPSAEPVLPSEGNDGDVRDDDPDPPASSTPEGPPLSETVSPPGSAEAEGAPSADLPEAGARCPFCQGSLERGSYCPACDLDLGSLQISGRTDTLRTPPRG